MLTRPFFLEGGRAVTFELSAYTESLPLHNKIISTYKIYTLKSF